MRCLSAYFLEFELERVLGMLVSAVSRRGERSEPERDTADTNGGKFGARSNCVLLWRFDYSFAFFCSLFFLRRQEIEAGTLAQRVFGGARELVQPSGGF